MKIEDLTAINTGPACRYYRKKFLNIGLNKWAKINHLAQSNVSEFENANTVSFSIFLAYLHNGFLNALPDIPLNEIVEYADYCKEKRAYRAKFKWDR